MRLDEIKITRDGGSSLADEPLHEVALWGARPLRVLAEILSDEMDNLYDSEDPEKSERASALVCEIEARAQEIEKTLQRLNSEFVKMRRSGERKGAALLS